MSINVGNDIGLEMYSDVDQFIRIEQSEALVMMGGDQSNLDFRRRVSDDYVILIPSGKWHNVINTGEYHLRYILFMRHLNIHMVQFIELKKMLKSIISIKYKKFIYYYK